MVSGVPAEVRIPQFDTMS